MNEGPKLCHVHHTLPQLKHHYFSGSTAELVRVSLHFLYLKKNGFSLFQSGNSALITVPRNVQDVANEWRLEGCFETASGN